MKQFMKLFSGVFILSVFLVACGSIESNITGSWKMVEGDETGGYIEIGEDRIIPRTQGDENPLTAEYILTETENGNFIIEIEDPETGVQEFLLEGTFENKNTVNVVDTPNGATQDGYMIRVDSISEEMEQDEEKAAEKAKDEDAKAQATAVKEKLATENEVGSKQLSIVKKRGIKTKKTLAKEEAKEESEKKLVQAKQAEEEEKEKDRAHIDAEKSNLQKKYQQKVDDLDDKIMRTYKEKNPDAQDIVRGYYGQYHDEWDDLLNEIWGELQNTMPEDSFETLKSEQNEWIKKKEQGFDDIPDEPASERARGMDYLAFETADRTYYLIENHLD